MTIKKRIFLIATFAVLSFFAVRMAVKAINSHKAYIAAAEEAKNLALFEAYDVPEKYCMDDCPQKGTVEHLVYKTYQYNTEGEPIEERENSRYIYLPYGYDESNSYNVLYLMHGGLQNEGFWLGQGDYATGGDMEGFRCETSTVDMLDQLIYQGYCNSLIVVTPCLATFPSSLGGVNGTDTFRYEFRNDLIPAVESKYATYTKMDTSVESLIQSRAHRGFAGLSMGSITSFSSIMIGCLDYVGYIGSFSGTPSEVDSAGKVVRESWEEYPILYWYNGNGTRDISHDGHKVNYHHMLDICGSCFIEGEDYKNGDNCIFVDKPGKLHWHSNWIVDLYNVLAVFFRK